MAKDTFFSEPMFIANSSSVGVGNMMGAFGATILNALRFGFLSLFFIFDPQCQKTAIPESATIAVMISPIAMRLCRFCIF